MSQRFPPTPELRCTTDQSLIPNSTLMISFIILSSIESFQRLQMFTQLESPTCSLTNVYRLRAICHLLDVRFERCVNNFKPLLMRLESVCWVFTLCKVTGEGASPHTDPRLTTCPLQINLFARLPADPRRLRLN